MIPSSCSITDSTAGATLSDQSSRVARVKLEVVEGDIAALEVDAVANAANDRLWMGAGVAGAIKRAGGETIEREAVAKGPIPVGTAVATGAGRLSAQYVLHGAVMSQDLRTNADLVARTTRSCLELADELGCRSLALPAFGTGVGGFPVEDCAQIMIAETRAFEPSALEHVVFAVFGEDAEQVFRDALAASE
jgi:O-acetyl-ADP-ribose deacetylase (regulator of RNase III)